MKMNQPGSWPAAGQLKISGLKLTITNQRHLFQAYVSGTSHSIETESKILDPDIIIKTDQARHPLLMSAQNLNLEFHGDGKPVHPDFIIRASKHDDDSWKMDIDKFNM
jgi:hypothetical protein